MNKQFDNKFDELFNDKFRDFEKNPPDYILKNVKANLNQSSIVSKISNFYKNNIIFGSLTLIIPALMVGIYAFSVNKPHISKQNQIFVNNSVSSKTQVDNSIKNNPSEEQASIISQNTHYSKTVSFNEEYCGLSCKLVAKSNSGKWICDKAQVSISAENSNISMAYVATAGKYIFKWIPTNEAENIEIHNIQFLKIGEPEKIKDLVSCGNEIALEASSKSQTGMWTSSDNIVFKNYKLPKTLATYNGIGKAILLWNNDMKCSVPDTFLVLFAEKPDAGIELQNEAKCNNSTVILAAKNKKMQRYEWDLDKGTAVNRTASTVNVKWENGVSHNVRLKAWSGENCFTTNTLNVKLPDPIDVVLETKNADCNSNGSIVARSISGNASYKYFWMNESKNSSSIRNSLSPGFYNLEVKDNDNCSRKLSAEVKGSGNINPSFVVSQSDMNSSLTVNFLNVTRVESPDENLKYLWDFGNGQSSSEESPKHTYLKEGIYQVKLTVSTAQGCSKSFINSEVSVGFATVAIPNIFSPNGDGQNDVFKIIDIGFNTFQCIIINAKGEKVYEWKNPDGGWNGTILNSGTPAAQGIYYYIVTATDNSGKSYNEKGNVKLVRE